MVECLLSVNRSRTLTGVGLLTEEKKNRGFKSGVERGGSSSIYPPLMAGVTEYA
jgi:hypothetical protein